MEFDQKLKAKKFDMKDIDDAFYIVDIEIHRDKHLSILGLSQEFYINKILEIFQMKNYSPSVAFIMKSDKFNLN